MQSPSDDAAATEPVAAETAAASTATAKEGTGKLTNSCIPFWSSSSPGTSNWPIYKIFYKFI